jgi:uncharacterized protein YacL
MVGIRKFQRGVVGVLDDGTVLVCDEKTEYELKSRGVKVLRVGKITAS